MNAIFEFFFCPVHGIFAPANWQFLAPLFADGLMTVRHLWSRVWGMIK